MDIFWKILPSFISVFSVFALGLVAYGKLKGSVVLKNECQFSQKICQQGVIRNIDDLKSLVIDLHEKQSLKIESLDLKREASKDCNAREMSEMAKSIGRIEGHLDFLIKDRGQNV